MTTEPSYDDENEKNVPGGLLELTPDERDLTLGGLFQRPDISKIPESFWYSPVRIKNQGDSDLCFIAGTPVLMEDLSYSNIEDIRVGDVVISHTGKPQRVIRTYKNRPSSDIYDLKVKGDYRTISATENHPFLSVRNIRGRDTRGKKNDVYLGQVQPEFTPLKEIKKGDWIAFPKITIEKDATLRSYEKDPDFLWVLGLYLAEGNINCEYRVAFTLHIEEVHFEQKIRDTMQKYGADVTCVVSPEHTTRVVYIQGKKWPTVFRELGGEYCDGKKIAQRLMVLSKDLQKNIVDGYFCGDGHMPHAKKNLHSVIGTSYELLVQVRTILSRLGFMTSFLKRKERIGRKQAWTLEYYTSQERSTFLEDDKNFYVKVVSVARNKIRSWSKSSLTTYNLEVENDNSYLVNNLSVHNCTGFATTTVSELQEDIELSPEYQFARTRQLINAPLDAFGANLRDACSSLVKFGSSEPRYMPWNLEQNGRDFFAKYTNIPESADNLAYEHRKKTYLAVDDLGYDLFDDIRLAIASNAKEECAVVTGAKWRPEWLSSKDGYLPAEYDAYGIGHAFVILGYQWKPSATSLKYEHYLVLQLSSGTGVGNGGLFYMDRKTANAELKFGNFLFKDIPLGYAKFLKDTGQKYEPGFFGRLGQGLKAFLK